MATSAKSGSSDGIKNQERQPPRQPVNWAPKDYEVDCHRESRLMQRMKNCMKKFENNKIFLTLLDQIRSPEMMHRFRKVLGTELKMQMVIYGIGSIENNAKSRLQLSLALLLKKNFSWIGDIEVFDPILSAAELKVLEFLGCSVLYINEKARRKVQKPTMFFMPCCSVVLYENLLRQNWRIEQLNKIVIFGNSFEWYLEYGVGVCQDPIVAAARHMLSARKFMDEIVIEMDPVHHLEAFELTTWHFFNHTIKQGLPHVDSSEIFDIECC